MGLFSKEPDVLKHDILRLLESKSCISTSEISNILLEDEAVIIGIVNSLKSLGDVIETEERRATKWQLTEEGEYILDNGSYEAAVFKAVKEAGGMSLDNVKTKIKYGNIGFSKAIANKWVRIDKPTGKIFPAVESVVDIVQGHLLTIRKDNANNVPDSSKSDYKKRKLIREVTTVSYVVSKGKEFSVSVSKADTELTAEMLMDGSWKKRTFKSYNFEALGAPVEYGLIHPLTKIRSELRDIFLGMGFIEMPTNRYVESSFWNFDALFQPQQHPARDSHDTFFLKVPSHCGPLPKDYMARVKKVHSEGDYGSKGYRYDWLEGEAKKNLLRTHTTAISTMMLANLGKNFKPVKFFSIDKVFRNENLDATHLAEFHQVEGVVADHNLTLGDLFGTLNEFFNKLGIRKLMYKPAYNPYTEPSMEIFCYHPGLEKWIEVGNSGMFRPEMLLPMGIPESVNVIAWGLSLERPTMVKYNINNIRDLLGPKVNLQLISDNPICRFDLEVEDNDDKSFHE